jgi:hypothetical protein
LFSKKELLFSVFAHPVSSAGVSTDEAKKAMMLKQVVEKTRTEENATRAILKVREEEAERMRKEIEELREKIAEEEKGSVSCVIL